MSIVSDDVVWRALADPTRRAVLDLCAEQPRTTGDVCAAFPALARTSVMKHLDLLVDAGLVATRREGRRRLNATVPATLTTTCLPWVERHARRLAQTMDRLRLWAEATASAEGGPRERSKPDRRAGRRRNR